MKLEEVKAFIQRFELRGMLADVGAELTVWETPGDPHNPDVMLCRPPSLHIEVSFLASDKDEPRSPTGRVHARKLRSFRRSYALTKLKAMDENLVKTEVRLLILDTLVHELDEDLWFDSKQLRDPHAEKHPMLRRGELARDPNPKETAP